MQRQKIFFEKYLATIFPSSPCTWSPPPPRWWRWHWWAACGGRGPCPGCCNCGGRDERTGWPLSRICFKECITRHYDVPDMMQGVRPIQTRSVSRPFMTRILVTSFVLYYYIGLAHSCHLVTALWNIHTIVYQTQFQLLFEVLGQSFPFNTAIIFKS